MNQRMPLGEESDSYSPCQLLFAPLRSLLGPFAKKKNIKPMKVGAGNTGGGGAGFDETHPTSNSSSQS